MTTRAVVIASGAVSALGSGRAAYDVTDVTRGARVAIAHDDELVRLGLGRPMAARVKRVGADGGDPATELLERARIALLAELEAARPGLDRDRIGLAVGTSSGGMRCAEQLFAARVRGEEITAELARASTYFAPFVDARAALEGAGLTVTRSVQLVTACTASTWALGVGLAWLRRDLVDVAIVGGYDAIGPFVAAGFEALRATSARLPAPFRLGRDGMALGEGAGLVALVREGDERSARAHFVVSGFGASTDAVHVTAPDRTGDGLARAGRAALQNADLAAGDGFLVSAHATATPYNDAMEARAIRTLFGDARPIVHPMKAQIGHTLGAAGVLETLAIGHALSCGVAPAAAGTGELDPDASVRLLDIAEPTEARAALKLSAAFGGANAAIVVESAGARPAARSNAPPRAVYLRALASVHDADADAVARTTGAPLDKVSRLDALCLLGATAVAKLAVPTQLLAGAGVLVGHALATMDANEAFYARVLSRGATAAEPRLFPATSPNVVAGHIAILFGATGPSAAVASGPGGAMDALELAIELVTQAHCDRIVVCAVDLIGPCAGAVGRLAFCGGLTEGAMAALITSNPDGAIGRVSLDGITRSREAFGHVVLFEWLRAGARSD